MLFAQGFRSAERLAGKIVSLFELSGLAFFTVLQIGVGAFIFLSKGQSTFLILHRIFLTSSPLQILSASIRREAVSKMVHGN